MKTLKIYDPALCCASGVCGTDVDTELLQLAGFLKNLEGTDVVVERYNLSQEPAVYTTHALVAAALKERGVDALPLVILDDTLVSEGAYPDLEKLGELLRVAPPLDLPDCSGCSGCN